MSLYKRGNTWWIDFTTASGERIRCSARTEDRAQAQELHDKLKADSWRVAHLGKKPERTWDEAALRWLQETSHKKSHFYDVVRMKWLQKHLTLKPIREITRDVVMQVADAKRQESSPSNANRYIALVRAILRRAEREWDWLERAPALRLFPEPKRRVRWITPEQVQKLLSFLPDHQRDVVTFALATGLRHGNVVRLEWQQVDLGRRVAWIYGDQAKGGRDIHVSLNQTAVDVLQRQVGKHASRVFVFRDRPIAAANTRAWREALKKAGISDFRWHDLRHTWASWLAQSGVPMGVIQEMGAWESPEMVRRYAHLSPAVLADHAKAIDTKMAQSAACDDETVPSS